MKGIKDKCGSVYLQGASALVAGAVPEEAEGDLEQENAEDNLKPRKRNNVHNLLTHFPKDPKCKNTNKRHTDANE